MPAADSQGCIIYHVYQTRYTVMRTEMVQCDIIKLLSAINLISYFFHLGYCGWSLSQQLWAYGRAHSKSNNGQLVEALHFLET